MTGHPDNEATERAFEQDALDAALTRMEETNGPVDEDAVTAISNRLNAEVEEVAADPADRAEAADCSHAVAEQTSDGTRDG